MGEIRAPHSNIATDLLHRPLKDTYFKRTERLASDIATQYIEDRFL